MGSTASRACTPTMPANRALVVGLVKLEGSNRRALGGISEPVGTGTCCIIRTMQRSIGGVVGARNGNNDKVIIGKEFSPAGLAAIQGFGGHKDFQIFMIGEDLNWVA